MSDDASYTSFLAKANQDPNTSASTHSQSHSTAQSKSKLDPTTPSTSSVPTALQNVHQYTYTSDTDEAFEPIVFSYSGSHLPSTKEFAGVIGQEEGRVEEIDIKEFDVQGEYGDLIGMVQNAGHGEVKVFRVEVSKTRCEYYVVSVGERKLLGVKAKAVES